MSACDHWDGFSHCTECCDNQTRAAYRLIGEQKAELATTRQMLRDTAQSLQDEENENTRLTEALALAKKFMRHHPACAWIADYGSVLVIGRVADCSCGQGEAMKTMKGWAVIDRKTGMIFRDSVDGGRTWNLYIFRTRKEAYPNRLMADYQVARVEIRELKSKEKR